MVSKWRETLLLIPFQFRNQYIHTMDVKNDCRLLEQEEGKYNRLADYKRRSPICDQEKRRSQLLQDQKRKREQTFSAFRNITELFLDEDETFEEEEEREEEFMEWVETKPKFPKLKDMFMFSEWMVKLPEDLEDKWLFVVCPVGKRCLIQSAKGHTVVYGRRGYRLAKFQSALPNGSHRDFSGYKYSNSEVTILDCIWSSQTKSYFILDMLSWKGQFYMDTEASFRGFWTKSKLEEMPWLSERSDRNPYPFIPLTQHPCDAATISSVMSNYPYFPSDVPKIDGILFYHSEAYYTPGMTPLVVWLKPFMLPEVLGVVISDMYSQMKPNSYVDATHYMESYELKRNQKEPKRSKRETRADERLEESNTEVEMFEE